MVCSGMILKNRLREYKAMEPFIPGSYFPPVRMAIAKKNGGIRSWVTTACRMHRSVNFGADLGATVS